MRRSKAILVAFCLAAFIPAGAFAAPAELVGKSVVLRWTENRIQRLDGEGPFRSFTVNLEMAFYVSTQGRVFNRMTSNSGSSEQVAGQPSQGPQRIPSFRGRTMTFMQPLQGMARRMSVSFEDGFANCTASIILAKQDGANSGFMRAFGTKRLQEIQSTTTSNTSCSIKPGNVFE